MTRGSTSYNDEERRKPGGERKLFRIRHWLTGGYRS